MNDWGIFYSLCCIVVPYVICYFVGKQERKEGI